MLRMTNKSIGAYTRGAETDTLEPFSEPAPQTKILPQKAPLGIRISSWLRGKR